jgi:uncharacterized damage-inducible protein DinB
MTGRGLMLGELERITANIRRLFALIQPEHYNWRPREGMRSLAALANHLAQIPSVDYSLLRGSTEEQIVALETELTRDNAEGWREVLTAGAAELARYIEHLTHDEYENNSGTAYFGRTQTNAAWLLEIITHLYHHRSQLFTYLKLNGYAVNTHTLYG